MDIEQMRGHKEQPVFHSKMGRLRKARKFCCDGVREFYQPYPSQFCDVEQHYQIRARATK